MDDLLKRHNGNNGIWLAGPGWRRRIGSRWPATEAGPGRCRQWARVRRSLEQVAAREAWLNEQSQLPVSGWRGLSTDLTALDGVQQSQGEETTNPPRALLVIDALQSMGAPQHASPENTDLLLIDENQSGLEQVESSVRFVAMASPMKCRLGG